MLKSTSFIFDGIPSEDYGVMIYFLDDEDKREISLGTDVEVMEDRLPKRITPIHYGVDMNKAMSFPLTFGSTDYLEDYDVDAILSWLTGHQQYKWLEYVDGDHYVRYKCHINNVRSVYINGLPAAFTCDVECDGQFGYEYPIVTEFTAYNDSIYEVDFLNKSSYNGYIYPQMRIEFDDNCNGLSIINETDNNREFKIDYFDRVSVDNSDNGQTYDTTLVQESANSSEEVEFMSWVARTLPSSDNYGDIIYGNNTLVALPSSNSNIALYSENNGESWAEAELPVKGSWTGCYGSNEFVAICTTPNTAIASYSQTGKQWNINPIELPLTQNWSKVVYVETEGFIENQYIALADGNSSIAAISTSGWAWQMISFPVSQDWKSIFYGAGKIFAIGGNQNIAIESTDAIDWKEIELPANGAWSDGCYGPNGFLVVCDSLYGSGSKSPVALTSVDGEIWKTIDFPIGSWQSVVYGGEGYIAVGDRQYAKSLDNKTFVVNTLPAVVSNITVVNKQYICALDTNKYIISDAASTIKGNFVIPISLDVEATVKNVYIYAELANTAEDTTYASNGSVLLASNVIDDETGDIVETGGDWVAATTDLRYGLGIDGVILSATYDSDTREIAVNYIADSNHSSVINAPLTITAEYEVDVTTDLGYEGLKAEIDNLNQIITTNKETLNLYEYFNMKFFRLVKGINHLKFQTTSGTCKIIITCEFLRKVGGR